MPRYRQVLNEESGKYELIELGRFSPETSSGMIINREIDTFVSPIDGEVISSRRQYDDHCRKHNVVPTAEFSKEFFDRKARERAKLFTGERSKKETLARKREIYETIMRAERNG